MLLKDIHVFLWQWIPYLSDHLSSPSVFSGILVTRSFVLCVYFVQCRSLFFLCTFSFGHCVVCFSSIYGCWLPLWYLQTLFHENLYTRCAKIKYIWQMKYLRRRFHNDISFIWIVLNISIYPRVIDDSTLFDPCLQPEV